MPEQRRVSRRRILQIAGWRAACSRQVLDALLELYFYVDILLLFLIYLSVNPNFKITRFAGP